MEDLKITANGYDFKPAQAAMQRYVDNNLLSGISWAVMVGRDLVDVNCVGWADKEAQTPLRTDHIFRVFSNTKLITSCAALLLFEEGKLKLDDPIEKFIPQLGNRKVLRAGADGGRTGRPAADLSTGDVLGILARHRRCGAAGRSHQRSALRRIHQGADSRSARHGRYRFRRAAKGSGTAGRLLRRCRPDGADEAGPYPDRQRAVPRRLSASHCEAQWRRWPGLNDA